MSDDVKVTSTRSKTQSISQNETLRLLSSPPPTPPPMAEREEEVLMMPLIHLSLRRGHLLLVHALALCFDLVWVLLDRLAPKIQSSCQSEVTNFTLRKSCALEKVVNVQCWRGAC